MCGELELPDGKISLCLDHQSSKDENGKPLPAVTRKHYNLATRIVLKKKRDVLDPWAAELRRIISEQKAADALMPLAACAGDAVLIRTHDGSLGHSQFRYGNTVFLRSTHRCGKL